MLTKLTVRNFKRFDDISIELGSPVVPWTCGIEFSYANEESVHYQCLIPSLTGPSYV